MECASTLADYVNSAMLSTRTPEALKNHRHYSAATSLEVISWIAQRLEISLEIKSDIRSAYKSVASTDQAGNTVIVVLYPLFS
jgi:hypothetical protein